MLKYALEACSISHRVLEVCVKKYAASRDKESRPLSMIILLLLLLLLLRLFSTETTDTTVISNKDDEKKSALRVCKLKSQQPQLKMYI